MKEFSVEDYLIGEVAKLGGDCEKWGVNGFEDRLIFLPRGRLGLLELKRPGKEPTALQAARIRRHSELGFTAGYANDFSSVQRFLARLQ